MNLNVRVEGYPPANGRPWIPPFFIPPGREPPNFFNLRYRELKGFYAERKTATAFFQKSQDGVHLYQCY